MSCLYDCGLVRREQKGRQVKYQMSDDGIAGLLRLAGELLAGADAGAGEGTRDCCVEKEPA